MDKPRLNPDHQFLVLETLQDLAGSPETLCTMLGTIQESMAEDLAQLQQHAKAQNAQAVGLKLHALKGYIPMLCQADLAERLVALEALASQPDTPAQALWAPHQVSALLADLGTLLHELQTAAAKG
jgi:HPt (histidine-containing phosphotransfer) domain-containing protein